MDAHTDSPSSRTAAHRSWPVRLYRLGAEPTADLSGSTSAEERLEMMWPLALEAWGMAGLSVPTYTREQAPVGRRFGLELPER